MSGEPTIHTTYGALLVGYMVSMFMYGVFCAQVVWYYRSYPNDRRSFKIIVGVLCTLETVQFILASDAIWHYYVVRGSVDAAFFLRSSSGLSGQVIPTELCVILVEVFYILRLWGLTNKNKYALLPLIPVVVGTAHGIGYIVTIIRFPYFSQTYKSRYFVIMTASSRVLTDIAIAGAMCNLLYTRRTTSAPRSKFLLKALCVWTLTTGVLTSFLTIAYLATCITMPNNMIYIAVFLIHSKICANAMLASLNTRNILRSMTNREAYIQELSRLGSSGGNQSLATS